MFQGAIVAFSYPMLTLGELDKVGLRNLVEKHIEVTKAIVLLWFNR